MAKQRNRLAADTTCVGVFEIADTYEIHILSSTIMSTIQEKHLNARLVHFRCFPEVLLALGYKEVLQKLSNDSLKVLIEKENLAISDDDLNSKITSWVEAKGFVNYGVTVKQLARQLSTNRTYLSQHINSTYRKTFNEWINDLRIGEAKRLLAAYPGLSMNDVAEKSGYVSQSHFTREFTKREQVSPRNWRENPRIDRENSPK
ncbi:helix-turn-helix domain-containing protein [Bacteroidales bacterium OttesenSCG-928-L03]|nr:helix-turn-helix domain-containing protein [Bacteroidales bacterium OttesenSCG-928-L03]